MIRKFSDFDREKNFQTLMENSSIIQEDLKQDFSYEEILCTIIPMSFDNPFESLQCELVACVTSEGMKMGILLEDVACMIMMQPNIAELKLEIHIVFIDKQMLYSSGLSLPCSWTQDLKKDCLQWQDTLHKESMLFVNLIALLGMDPNSPIQ